MNHNKLTLVFTRQCIHHNCIRPPQNQQYANKIYSTPSVHKCKTFLVVYFVGVLSLPCRLVHHYVSLQWCLVANFTCSSHEIQVPVDKSVTLSSSLHINSGEFVCLSVFCGMCSHIVAQDNLGNCPFYICRARCYVQQMLSLPCCYVSLQWLL